MAQKQARAGKWRYVGYKAEAGQLDSVFQYNDKMVSKESRQPKRTCENPVKDVYAMLTKCLWQANE
jgi:hypothetical protein